MMTCYCNISMDGWTLYNSIESKPKALMTLKYLLNGSSLFNDAGKVSLRARTYCYR